MLSPSFLLNHGAVDDNNAVEEGDGYVEGKQLK